MLFRWIKGNKNVRYSAALNGAEGATNKGRAESIPPTL